jgi:AraC-like DNA-binding protein
MVIKFDTRGVPETHRVDYWRTAMLEVLSADCMIEPASASSSGFGAAMQAISLGELELVDLSGTAYRSSRQGRGRDAWVSLLFQLEGCASVHSRRRSTQLVAGDACFIPPHHDMVVDRETEFRQVSLEIRSDLVEEILPGWQSRLSQRFESGGAGLGAVSQLVRYVADQHVLLDEACREHFCAALLKLLPQVLGESDADSRVASGSTSRMTAYHRKRVEQFVQEHIRDAHLSVDLIARELNLSRRYIHKLFNAQGPTVMQWVMEQRLDSARGDLMRRDGRSIGEVAYSWGFNSLSHFSRAFRKRFGFAPSGR